jgi:hypothetical protein
MIRYTIFFFSPTEIPIASAYFLPATFSLNRIIIRQSDRSDI